MAQALDTGTRTVMFHQEKIIFDVSGDERAQMQVTDLMALFRKNSHSEITDDALLLAH